MVSCPKTFDVSKYGKMTELTKTKHRFGILVEFTHNIAYQIGFENSTGNTTYILVTGCDLIQRSKLIPFHLNESDVSSLYRLLSDIEVGQSDISLLILAL